MAISVCHKPRQLNAAIQSVVNIEAVLLNNACKSAKKGGGKTFPFTTAGGTCE
jgi:hypothetical protein